MSNVSNKNKKYLLYQGSVYRQAQDEDVEDVEDTVDERDLVTELEENPVEQWRDYLQPIIRMVQQQLGVPVTLIGPRMDPQPGGPEISGFDIAGHLEFPEGRSPEISERFKDNPVSFRAYILPNGDLTSPIQIGPEFET